MRVLLQRVHYAKCVVEGNITGEIQKGFLCFVGISKEDTLKKVEAMATKIAHERLFDDSFDLAANAMDAKLLYQLFNDRLAIFCKVETGIFQVHMNIDSSNDGPVIIMYEN